MYLSLLFFLYINVARVMPVTSVIQMPFLHSQTDHIYIVTVGKFCSLLRNVLFCNEAIIWLWPR